MGQMKRILAFSALFLSFSCFSNNFPTSCDQAPTVDKENFCSAFKPIAQCHCQADGHLPPGMCVDMNFIYSTMITKFGSQYEACKWQSIYGVPYKAEIQECMDDWDCYRLGSDSKGICRTKCA
jgi:hypothetical protein